MFPPLEKTIASDYDEVLAKVPAALATEGFGVLTEIDMHKTMRAKLGIAFRRYMILGACNPSLAHHALEVTPDAGLVLPRNVIVYEQGGSTVVKAIDPMTTAAAQNPKLLPLAEEVRSKLARVIERIA
jgi:uncharacterized protein (DUF302 family)